MKTLAVIIAALPLAACAATNAEPAPAPSPMAKECNAEAVQNLIGQKATVALGQQILVATNANILRWGPPRSAWTMDFRSGRVNISYDDKMMIDRITCG